ncbi:MAG TPA: PIG-L family deacetylase [Aggregatilineales bacterium]|nr:PIG-L family deacetylase [Aggregatilineales bacterium]
MKFELPTAELFIPDGLPEEKGLSRTTHLAIGAHQDDLEFMAAEPIIACYQQLDKWFMGVVVTDGRGSPRNGLYAQYNDEEMRVVRFKEQKKAASVGEYSAQALLDHPSKSVKDGSNKQPVNDLIAILKATRPEFVYTHNLADKHDTHVGVALKVIEAIRSLPAAERPKHLYGCEVWRDLDWLHDPDKVIFDVSAHENLQASLMGVFDSQISGGKRYDLATAGRRRAHATYFASHGTDTATGLSFGMDMTPLITDTQRDPLSLVQQYIQHFEDEVTERVRKMQGQALKQPS